MNETSTPQRPQQLPEILGLELSPVPGGFATGRFVAGDRHMAPNGYMRALPQGAVGFTTIELKSNFLGTAKVGETVTCEARLVHGGRTTQVWDAEVRNETSGKPMALFRCTQLLLYPKG